MKVENLFNTENIVTLLQVFFFPSQQPGTALTYTFN